MVCCAMILIISCFDALFSSVIKFDDFFSFAALRRKIMAMLLSKLASKKSQLINAYCVLHAHRSSSIMHKSIEKPYLFSSSTPSVSNEKAVHS